MTSLLLGLVFAVAPSESSVEPRRATDELFRSIPREVGAVAVLEDLDGFLSRLEQAEVVKRLRRTKLLGLAVEAEVVRRWKELDSAVQNRIGIGLETLRKDVFGLSVVLAYWPKSGGPKDEAGLFLVRARSAKRLDELLHTLFRVHGGEPPRRSHNGVSYWASRDGERQQYLLALGPIGLLTDDEEAVQRVIQTIKGGKSWHDDPAFAAMRGATPAGAIFSIFLLPRTLDAKLSAKPAGKPGEAMLQETVVGLWKSVEWASFTAHVETSMQFGLHVSVDRSKLPTTLGRRVPSGEGPIPTQGLAGTIASVSGGFDLAAVSDFIDRASRENNPKEAEATERLIHSLFMGAKHAAEVEEHLGPRFGMAVLENPAGPAPDAVFTLELRPSQSPNATVTNGELVEHALRFAALVLAFEANKSGEDRWELRTESVAGARVHIAAGGKKAPKSVEPCFTVHKGWILIASSPGALRQVLTATRRSGRPDEVARLDLQAARRAAARMAEVAQAMNPQGWAFVDALAEAIPLVSVAARADGPVHHWTLELPPAK